MRCDKCYTDWPEERMLTLEGQRLCELCWRVVIYPYKLVLNYRNYRFRTKESTPDAAVASAE